MECTRVHRVEAYSERSVREEGMDILGEGTSEQEGMELQEDTNSPCGAEGSSEIKKYGKNGIFMMEGLPDVMVKHHDRIYSGVAFVGIWLRGDGLQGLERGERRERI